MRPLTSRPRVLPSPQATDDNDGGKAGPGGRCSHLPRRS
jgi:hypothetical protein